MAPSEDPPHYLHPDFDPWKIKMDQIRDILIQHHVKTPTGIVKKQQLVDLFNQHIRPQVPKFTPEEKGDVDLEDKKQNPAAASSSSSSSKARQPPPPPSSSSSSKQTQENKTPELVSTRPTRIRRASSKARMASEETIDEPVE
ncbi:inner nuclear membrane protein enriched at telomere/subtelomere region, partial [Modicella reniformis]